MRLRPEPAEEFAAKYNKVTVEPSLSCYSVSDILTVMSLITTILLPVACTLHTCCQGILCCSGPSRYYLRRRISFRRQLILPVSAETPPSSGVGSPAGPRYVPLCATHCVTDTVYLFHIIVPPCNSVQIQL